MDQLTYRQTQLSAQKTFNQIAVDVASQVMALDQARAQYRRPSNTEPSLRNYSREKRGDFRWGFHHRHSGGARRDLATAQSSELAAAAAYIHNRIALDQGLGLTLERTTFRRGCRLAGGNTAQVTRDCLICSSARRAGHARPLHRALVARREEFTRHVAKRKSVWSSPP